MGETTVLITVKDVLKMTGYKSRTTLWRRVKAGDFPTPVALSDHATRWKKEDVESWVSGLPKLRYGGTERTG